MSDTREVQLESINRAEQIEREIIAVIGSLMNRLAAEQPVHQDQIEAVGVFFGMATAMAEHFRGQLSDERYEEIFRQFGKPTPEHDAVIERMVREREDLTHEERWLLMNREIAHSKSFDEFAARQTGTYLQWIFADMNIIRKS